MPGDHSTGSKPPFRGSRSSGPGGSTYGPGPGDRPRRGRRARANPGRVIAAQAISDVEAGGHAEDALAALFGDRGGYGKVGYGVGRDDGSQLSQGDRALAWFLTLAALRYQATVDAALQARLSQPLQALDRDVRAVLRIGAVELLHGRAEAYAVVSQAVEVARRVGVGRASSLVNAVLRRVEPVTPAERGAALDHPGWLVARWDARHGEAAVNAWCANNQQPPPLSVVSKGPVEELIALFDAKGVVHQPVSLGGEVVPGVLRVAHEGRLETLPGFDEGSFWVQDPSSVWMADLVPVTDGCRVLDACAAPGGKSFRLASRGAKVLAVDLSEERLDRLDEGATRVALDVPTLQHDWTEGPIAKLKTVDAVLIDAPCTGLGTLRRRPEIRWRRTPEDLIQSAERQRMVIAAASQHVRAGGALVYVVCSPEPEEGEQVVQWFLEQNPDFSLELTRSTAPPSDHEDAFWGARLVRA